MRLLQKLKAIKNNKKICISQVKLQSVGIIGEPNPTLILKFAIFFSGFSKMQIDYNMQSCDLPFVKTIKN